MKKTFKKIFLFSFVVCISVIICGAIALGALYFMSPRVQFDSNKIKHSSSAISVYDNNNKLIKDINTTANQIKINTLPNYVSESFISIEDKAFYRHNGLNYKRVAKAMLKNIKSFKIKEGASTISQQLIKNTHLTNERTFTRKINEVVLAKELEQNFTKQEILEHYLNIIYFGDNCYGIENASNHYFSKSSKDLSLEESATLAGLIKSPSTYSPIKNSEKSKKRRNIVLNEMLKDGKISFDDYNKAVQKPLKVNLSPINTNSLNSYSQACIDEAINILKMPAKQIAIGEYKIYSYLNTKKQSQLEAAVNSYNSSDNCSAISINSKTGEIEAYVAKSNLKLLDVKRQPGSSIKPILVYAPAFNENLINSQTQINDEKININGYAPTNISNKYYGYMSVKECLAKSLNIPAVKIMSYVGVDTAKEYASKCKINFDKSDNNLSLALGGMTYGTSLKELASSYTSLSNSGNFVEGKFISYITDKNGKIVYSNSHSQTRVFREDTAYLITDLLKECTKTGTSKKLSDLNFEICSKTGTVGKKANTDAWNISYTSQDIIGVWVGNVDNSPISTFGSGYPTDIVKQYANSIYENKKPPNFVVPDSVCMQNIDLLSLKNEHIVVLANNFIPEKYIGSALFSKFNLPKEKSTTFISVEPARLDGKVSKNKAILLFEAQDYLIYEIYKQEKDKTTLLSVISNRSGQIKQEFDMLQNSKAKYFVITKLKNFTDNSEIISDKSNIVELHNNASALNQNNQTKDNKKWYI